MNYRQTKALTELLEGAAQLAGVVLERMHLGIGSQIITVSARDDNDYSDGSMEVTLWRGGRGCLIVVGTDGTLYDYDEYDNGQVVEVELGIREDGTFATHEVSRV